MRFLANGHIHRSLGHLPRIGGCCTLDWPKAINTLSEMKRFSAEECKGTASNDRPKLSQDQLVNLRLEIEIEIGHWSLIHRPTDVPASTKHQAAGGADLNHRREKEPRMEHGSNTDERGPSDKAWRPPAIQRTNPTTNNQQPTTNYELRTTNYELRTTNQAPSTKHQAPSTDPPAHRPTGHRQIRAPSGRVRCIIPA